MKLWFAACWSFDLLHFVRWHCQAGSCIFSHFVGGRKDRLHPIPTLKAKGGNAAVEAGAGRSGRSGPTVPQVSSAGLHRLSASPLPPLSAPPLPAGKNWAASGPWPSPCTHFQLRHAESIAYQASPLSKHYVAWCVP